MSSNVGLREKEINNENLIELNIQPAASILNVFSRLSYKSWYAKYDITLDWGNFEVKTVVATLPIVKLKHDQLFNGDTNYLVVCCIEANDYGESLEELIISLRSMQPQCFGGLNFALRLEKEMRRVSTTDATSKRFTLHSMQVYSALEIPSIETLPDCISDLHYTYTLEYETPLDLSNLFSQHSFSMH